MKAEKLLVEVRESLDFDFSECTQCGSKRYLNLREKRARDSVANALGKVQKAESELDKG